MPAPRFLRLRYLLPAGVVLLAAVVTAIVWWPRPPRLPPPGSADYEAYAEAFQVGTAALDSGLVPQAEKHLSTAIARVPQEPAAWANRGLLYLRNNQLKEAAADLARASDLAPDNGDIAALLGFLAEQRGRLSEAVAHFRRASAADPADVQRLYQLVKLVVKEGKSDADRERQRLLETILEQRPTSLPVLAERAIAAARNRDRQALADSLDRLLKLSRGWPESAKRAREALDRAAQEAAGPAWPPTLNITLQQMLNGLREAPGFTRSLREIDPDRAQVGVALQNFLRLAPLRTRPDEPDRDLTFTAAAGKWADDVARQRWEHVAAVWLTAQDERPAVFVADAKQLRRADAAGPTLAFPGAGEPPSPAGVVPIDCDNDGRTDLLLAGAGGLRLFTQGDNGAFADATAAMKLPKEIVDGAHFGAWAVDYDMDGDLDIVLAPLKGAAVVLRNNGDGTFTAVTPFVGVAAIRAFAWADLDRDGAAEACILDATGRLHVFANERSGQFRRRDVPADVRGVALAVADLNDDGGLDLAVLTPQGTVRRLSDRDAATVAESTLGGLHPGAVRLVAADVDNNGTVDLVVCRRAAAFVWLADGAGKFEPLPPRQWPSGVADVLDLDGDGRTDLLGLTAEGRPTWWKNNPTKDYHALRVLARANPKGTGDQRLNSFALGSDVELRAGTLIVRQPIDRPAVHFGLGRRKTADLLRFVWTNGALQYEFDKPPGAVVRVEQRLTGSCPFLFSWDGARMVFVTDFCWSTPLGLYINAQAGSGFVQTTDWFKVRGDQLRPRGGEYDLRVNANLWETHYLDQLALMVVDHPPGTEVFVDERFFLTPTSPRLYLTAEPRPVAKAWDHHGQDVTDLVRATDGRYLDRCGRGVFQGVTNMHWVEVDLGPDAPTDGPLYLLAHGWIHPTDSSINFAMEQGNHPRPLPLLLEVPDGNGGWRQAGAPLGFPAGKNKTLVIRLDGVGRRFRLRTNLEVFWDSLSYARGLDAAACRVVTLAPKTAQLRFRGIVAMRQADSSSPELPCYDEVVHHGQAWRDLVGFHTRFGDVRELVEKVDDRYVIMNSGDEILMRFAAPSAPPPGWRRDYVWVSDGWTKDGNLNTRWGKTVLPLPWHGMKDYTAAPGALADDPVHRRFPNDWQKYHTRYVTPDTFEQGLRGPRRPRQ